MDPGTLSARGDAGGGAVVAVGRPRPSTGQVALVAALVGIALAIAGCGGNAAGGGGGGGPDWQAIIAETQAAFGTSMVSGSVEGETLKITLVKGFGPGGAKLFMCGNVKEILAKHGATGVEVVMVDTEGRQLATMADCQD